MLILLIILQGKSVNSLQSIQFIFQFKLHDVGSVFWFLEGKTGCLQCFSHPQPIILIWFLKLTVYHVEGNCLAEGVKTVFSFYLNKAILSSISIFGLDIL